MYKKRFPVFSYPCLGFYSTDKKNSDFFQHLRQIWHMKGTMHIKGSSSELPWKIPENGDFMTLKYPGNKFQGGCMNPDYVQVDFKMNTWSLVGR